MIFYYLSLVLISLLGISIVREDVRCKKISNKIIVIGFLLGFFLLAVGLAGGYMTLDYVEKTAINAVLALLVAFLIWSLGFWPAGDAKFFTLLSFLLPLYYYKNSYLVFFPSFALLFNIFVAFLLFVIFKAVISMAVIFFHFLRSGKDRVIFFRKYFEIKKEKILEIFKNKKSTAQVILKAIFQLALALCFYFIIARFILKNPINLIAAIFFMIIFRLVYTCINLYTQKYSCKKIRTEDISAGDNLEKNQLSQSEDGKKIIKKLGKLRPEGLEDFQVEILQKYFSDNNIKEIIIHKTIPFSIWILVGVVLTIFFNGIIRINFP